ncbi:hypothetical protein GCM10027431_32740 [Lysobacter rhizosphaerae]
MSVTTRAKLNPEAGVTSLMEVVPGEDTFLAISQADCLDSSVRTLLTKAVAEGGMDVDTAFLCGFALDASSALRAAAGVTA